MLKEGQKILLPSGPAIVLEADENRAYVKSLATKEKFSISPNSEVEILKEKEDEKSRFSNSK